MATLAELQAMREKLVKARASGISSVSYDGRTTAYKSDAEMKTALIDLDRQIAAASGAMKSPFVSFVTGKGL